VAGGLAPRAVSDAGASAAAPATSAAAAAAAARTSSWNAAGTYEARSLGDQCRARLRELLRELRRREEDSVVAVPGVARRLVLGGLHSWGESSAEIVTARSKVKHIYDFDFSVSLLVEPEGAQGAAAPADDEEDGTAPAAAPAAPAAAPAAAASSAAGAPAEAAKPPRVLLHFCDVSSTTEGAPRELRLERGSPAPDEAHWPALRAALADSPLVAAVRRAVEEVVAAFKSW